MTVHVPAEPTIELPPLESDDDDAPPPPYEPETAEEAEERELEDAPF